MPARRDINTLSDTEVGDYIHALSILRARPASDLTSYAYQAAIHNDGEVGPCEHGNDLFFAWHRAHLYYFERLLQASDPPRTQHVTIPYWDWSRPDVAGGRYPVRFSQPGLEDAERFQDGAPLEPNTLSITVNRHAWNEFGGWPKGSEAGDYGDFEWGPHNYTHGNFIGGKMGDPATAAEDPIYWSFHCFIDLLWEEWQRRNPNQPATSPDAILRGLLDQPMHRVSDFQDVGSLSYSYEQTPELRAALQAAVEPPRFGALASRRSLQALFDSTFANELERTSHGSFALDAVAPARRLLIKLEELKIPTVGSYTLRAYVHPRGVSQSELERFEAGYVSLWKAHMGSGQPGHGGHGHGGHTPGHGTPHHPANGILRFDVTAAVERLSAAERGDAIATIWFLPAPRATGGAAPRAELLAEMSLRDVVLEEFR